VVLDQDARMREEREKKIGKRERERKREYRCIVASRFFSLLHRSLCSKKNFLVLAI
jgi:hypothetical protein